MGRRILIVFLVLGAVLGFAAGIRGVMHRHDGYGRHAEFERHVADVCVAAAQRVLSQKGGGVASPD